MQEEYKYEKVQKYLFEQLIFDNDNHQLHIRIDSILKPEE